MCALCICVGMYVFVYVCDFTFRICMGAKGKYAAQKSGVRETIFARVPPVNNITHARACPRFAGAGAQAHSH